MTKLFFSILLILFSLEGNCQESIELRQQLYKIYKNNMKKRKSLKHIYLDKKKRHSFHLSSLAVIEDYDDLLNDNLYLYLIIYKQGKTYLKVTSLYKGYDEGETILFSPNDRILFEKLELDEGQTSNEIVIDYAIIESDGEDYSYLHSISLRAWEIIRNSAEFPMQAMGDILVTFLESVANLETDSRLVTDTLVLKFSSFKELNIYTYRYSSQRYWSEYTYDLTFRVFSNERQ